MEDKKVIYAKDAEVGKWYETTGKDKIQVHVIGLCKTGMKLLSSATGNEIVVKLNYLLKEISNDKVKKEIEKKVAPKASKTLKAPVIKEGKEAKAIPVNKEAKKLIDRKEGNSFLIPLDTFIELQKKSKTGTIVIKEMAKATDTDYRRIYRSLLELKKRGEAKKVAPGVFKVNYINMGGK